MSEQQPEMVHDLELIKAELAKLQEKLFTVANDFALGTNGLPKNGTVAVSLHRMSSEANNVLEALRDPAFANHLNQRQIREHMLKFTLELHGFLPSS